MKPATSISQPCLLRHPESAVQPSGKHELKLFRLHLIRLVLRNSRLKRQQMLLRDPLSF